MRPRLSRLCVLWGLVALAAWMVHRGAQVWAQGSARAGASNPRVRLLCDLAKAIEWPLTNQVLTIALVRYNPGDDDEIRRILGAVPEARWRELWVTNYSKTVHPDVLQGLPGCGILGLSQVVGARYADTYIRGVSARSFLTVGDGFQTFAGMINFSQDGSLIYSPRKMEEKGFRVPQALFDSYRDSGVPVKPAAR